ncbi:hypothetical protein BsWGS_05769 [Bradybaena similaris]
MESNGQLKGHVSSNLIKCLANLTEHRPLCPPAEFLAACLHHQTTVQMEFQEKCQFLASADQTRKQIAQEQASRARRIEGLKQSIEVLRSQVQNSGTADGKRRKPARHEVTKGNKQRGRPLSQQQFNMNASSNVTATDNKTAARLS